MKITDDQIDAAFEGCDFGPTVKTTEERKDFLAKGVMETSAGYSVGWTAQVLMCNLGLLPAETRRCRPNRDACRWAYHQIFDSQNSKH